MADIIKLDMTKLWASSGDKIQPSDAQMASGWLVQQVPRQTWNWFENRQDQNIAYLLQKGLPEWDSTTEYLANKSFMNRGGLPYKCIQTNTGQDPTSSPDYWERVSVQYSTSLEALRVLTPAADRLPYYSGASTAALTTFTAFARSLLDDADAATARTTLSAQTLNSTLTALSSGGLVPAVNVLPYFDSTSTATGTLLTAYARTLLDDGTAAAARTTLEVDSASDVAANLAAGLATKQPLHALLTSLSAQTTAANQITYYTGSNVAAVTALSVYARGFLAVADAAAARTLLGADNATNLTTGTIPLARIPTSLTGVNAATATALQTARTIQGVSFNGTANITLSVVDKDSGTGSAVLPKGTTAQRTASPADGMIRYNSDTNEFEGYQNGSWAGIGGGNPLFTVLWWPSRTAIPAGYVAADGQTLTRTAYQAAWARINAGDVPLTTEANWVAVNTARGYYTPGNGTTTFRIPDMNGKSAGTLGSMFLRGDGTLSAGTAGVMQVTDILKHGHNLSTDINGTLTASASSGGSGSNNAMRLQYLGNDTTVNYPLYAANSGGLESRPYNVTGVWIIKLIGGATAASQEDASVAVAALDAVVYKRTNILDAVSQTSGVPTGGIIETGSNSAGRYTKFANGTVIMELATFDMSVGANSNTQVNRGLPTPLVLAAWAYVSAYGQPDQSNVHYGFNACFPLTSTSIALFHFNGPTPQNLVRVGPIVIGRWF